MMLDACPPEAPKLQPINSAVQLIILACVSTLFSFHSTYGQYNLGLPGVSTYLRRALQHRTEGGDDTAGDAWGGRGSRQDKQRGKRDAVAELESGLRKQDVVGFLKCYVNIASRAPLTIPAPGLILGCSQIRFHYSTLPKNVQTS